MGIFRVSNGQPALGEVLTIRLGRKSAVSLRPLPCDAAMQTAPHQAVNKCEQGSAHSTKKGERLFAESEHD
jgi:hypothetical protein